MQLLRVIACMSLAVGCKSSDKGGGSRVSAESCGVTVEILSVKGRTVELRFTNVVANTVGVGPSPQATFVDVGGAAMKAKLVKEGWFEEFQLPAKSHKDTTVTLDGSGDAARVDRIEIPMSGASPIDRCTIHAAGLASS